MTRDWPGLTEFWPQMARISLMLIAATFAPIACSVFVFMFLSFLRTRRLSWLRRRAGEIIVPLPIKEAKKRFPPWGGAIFFGMRVSG